MPIRIFVHQLSSHSISALFAEETTRWLFFLSGVALLVAAFLLPAASDLRTVEVIRDQSLLNETHHNERNARYEAFLGALERGDPQTIELLAQSQLGVIPSDRDALIIPGLPGDTMVFELLEPDPVALIARAAPASLLEKLTTSARPRLMVIAIGFGSVLFGILPAAIRRSDRLDEAGNDHGSAGTAGSVLRLMD